MNNIGIVHQERGDFRAALEYYLRSLAIKERIGPTDDVVSTLGNIGGVYALQGNAPQAIEYITRAIALAERFNIKRQMVDSTADLGRMLMESGRYDESEAHLTRALALAEQSNYKDIVGTTLNALANVDIVRKQWAQAAAHLTRAAALFDEIGDPINSGHVLLSRAAMAKARGRAEDAVAFAQRARDVFASIGRPTALLDAEVMLADAFTDLRQWRNAIVTYDRAIGLTESGLDVVAGDMEDRLRYLESSAHAYFGLAHAYASSGRNADALTAAERGRARTLLDMMAGQSGDDELTPAERDRQVDLDTQLVALGQRIAADRGRTQSGGTLNPALAAESEHLRRSRDAFYLGLDATHPRLAFARGRAPVLSAREIAAALPVKSGLIEVVVAQRVTWIMLLVPRPGLEPRLVVRPSPLPTAKVAALAEQFTRQVSTRDLSFSPNAGPTRLGHQTRRAVRQSSAPAAASDRSDAAR